jgi:hypothetical protein
MPEISRFLGIIVFMVYDDHNPPHFHARYGDFEISVEIMSGIVDGKFPRRALSALLEWYLLHQGELRENWDLARSHDPLKMIDPLE